MSKITKALEKAARERLLHQREHATVTGVPAMVPLELIHSGDVTMPQRQIRIDPHIVSATDADSPIAEQYRILRTNLQSLRLRPGPKVLVVTSAMHGEGKSVTAINLSLAVARQEHMKVVLVDADLRNGSIHKWLGLEDRLTGVSTVLRHGGELNGSLVRLQSIPLAVLPGGERPEHPAELLESSSMKRLLATLKTQFDLVIIDAPPVLPVADAAILAAQADGVILVVRAGKTQRRTAAHARALLQQARATILGCVLTHADFYVPGYYGDYQRYRYGAKNGDGKTDSRGSSAQPATAAEASAAAHAA